MASNLLSGFVIDRRSTVAPYEQIRDALAERIRSGALATGQQLPTMGELCELLSVSPHTISRAIRELKREGWVIARRGSGVFAGARPAGTPFQKEDPLELRTDDFSWLGEPRRTRFLNALQRRVPGVRIVMDSSRKDVYPAYGPMLPCLAHDLEDLADVFLPLWGRRSVNDPRIAPFCHDGKLLLVPMGFCADVGAVMLNRRVFDEAGIPLPNSDWTPEEMMEIARRVHAPERGRYGVAMTQNYLEFMYFLWREGGEHFDPDGRTCLVDSPEGVRAAEKMSEIARLGPPQEKRGAYLTFAEGGRTAMLFCYSGAHALVTAQMRDPHCVVCLPEYRRRIVPLDVNGYAVRRGAASREAAIQFLRLLPDLRDWCDGPRKAPLAPDTKREDLSEITGPFRESLRFARQPFSNIPDERRSLAHDVAGNLLDSRIRRIAAGDPSMVRQGMQHLALDMTHIVDAARRLRSA